MQEMTLKTVGFFMGTGLLLGLGLAGPANAQSQPGSSVSSEAFGELNDPLEHADVD